MPQASAELSAKWDHDGNGENRAQDFLIAAGYRLRRDWHWTMPDPLHVPTEEELSAITFMIQEWDFGGIINEGAGTAFGRGYTG